MADKLETLHIKPEGVHTLWDDGHQGFYPHWYLRAACKCADCQDSAGHSRMAFYDAIPRNVRALDWTPLGNYAVELLWSDGHPSGIYALETLRQLCRCPDCVTKAIATRRSTLEQPRPPQEKHLE